MSDSLLLSREDVERLRAVLLDAREVIRYDVTRLEDLHARNAADYLLAHLGTIADTLAQIDALLTIGEQTDAHR